MKVLVAGGAGFIGSHLVDRLVERGDEVVVVDDLSTGSAANLAHHLDAVTFRRHDVVALPGLLDALAAHRPFGRVLHLASPASPPEFLRRPIETLDVGSTGTHHLLDVARADGARFVLASTSEIYGDPLVHPQREDYHGNVDPIGERAVYDEAKRFAETLTSAYRRTFGVDTAIARIFNTYGPRMDPDDGRVVTNFLHQARRGDAITIYGDGSQTRSFCYVDDLVTGLLALADSDCAEPVNLGNPAEITVAELAAIAVEMTGSSSEIEYRPLPQGDPRVRRPDIERARTRLGWEPRVDLRTGLQMMIDSLG